LAIEVVKLLVKLLMKLYQMDPTTHDVGEDECGKHDALRWQRDIEEDLGGIIHQPQHIPMGEHRCTGSNTSRNLHPGSSSDHRR
jgi:hypothetical protein